MQIVLIFRQLARKSGELRLHHESEPGNHGKGEGHHDDDGSDAADMIAAQAPNGRCQNEGEENGYGERLEHDPPEKEQAEHETQNDYPACYANDGTIEVLDGPRDRFFRILHFSSPSTDLGCWQERGQPPVATENRRKLQAVPS